MKVLTEYLKFHTRTHRAYVYITPQVEHARQEKRRERRDGVDVRDAYHGGRLCQ